MLDSTRFPHGHRLNNVSETGANNQTKVALKDNKRGKISDLVMSVRPEHGLFKTAMGKVQVLSQISYLKTDIRSYDLLKISVNVFQIPNMEFFVKQIKANFNSCSNRKFEKQQKSHPVSTTVNVPRTYFVVTDH